MTIHYEDEDWRIKTYRVAGTCLQCKNCILPLRNRMSKPKTKCNRCGRKIPKAMVKLYYAYKVAAKVTI